jgi:chromosomal replication initiation ATPase DnaA
VTDPSAATQLALPLPVRTALGEADFLVAASNQDAVRWLDRWPDWPGGGLLLHGPAASGKSHLAAIWADRASAARVKASKLTLEQALGLARGMAVDDIEAVADPKILFHLINSARARGVTLLLTAREPASRWSSGLADLDSRLRALPSVGLHAPDDALLSGLATKLFADRQITVPDTVIAFMLARLERSCAAIAAAVEHLDRASLAQRRKVTRQLAQDELILPTDD